MTTDNATHWIDHMPALPLAEDMPIRNKTNTTRSAIVLERAGTSWYAWFHDTDALGVVGHVWTDSKWVIDLDTPAGQRYAATILYNEGKGECEVAGLATQTTKDAAVIWFKRAALGTLSDADRLAIAQALAELV